MTESAKLACLKLQIDEVGIEDDTLSTYLEIAGDIILNHLYPFGDRMEEEVPVPQKYHMLQVQIACELIAKRGAEGQTTHDENGIKRVYASSSVSPSLLSQITPYVGRI